MQPYNSIVGLVALILLTGSHAERTRASDPPTATATITIGSTKGNLITSRFVGFSYEKSVLSEGLFTERNIALINLFKMLGPGILRVGGNSVNETTWSASGPGLTASFTAPSDIDRLASFLRATGWKVIYGLNGTSSTPRLSASEARYAAKSLDGTLYGFEIGNEPDTYHANGLKPKTYTITNFLADWEQYRAAIDRAVPGAVMTGPATAANYRMYTVPFAAVEARKIALLTEHYYRGNGQAASSTIDLLLSPDPNLAQMLSILKMGAATRHITKGYRIAEANSFYNGGAPEISNTFGSALWALEFCFTLAENGATGVNFHGGGDGPGYTPIADDHNGHVTRVRTEYYGILLFSMMAHGRLLATHATGTASALSNYAVAKTDGSLAIVLANNNRTETVGVSLSLPAGKKSATNLILTAPSLDSSSGESIGGATIDSQGSWKPTQVLAVPTHRSSIYVDVPPSTAILTLVRP